MTFAKLPIPVADQVIGRVTVNQLRDNLDSMLQLLSLEHGTADGVFDVGQSRVGAHSGATAFGGGTPLRGSYAVAWAPEALLSGADAFMGPIGPECKSVDGFSMVLKIRGMTTASAIASSFESDDLSTPYIFQVSVDAAPNDSAWPWRLKVTQYKLSGTSWVAGSADFSLALWGA